MAFDNNKLGELRPNQIITTFGPGSIVDAVKDSVTVLDTNSHLILVWTAFTCPGLPTVVIFPWYPSLMFTYAPSAEDCLMSEITLTWICIFRRASTARIAAGRHILLVLSLCVKTDIWMTSPGDGGSIKGIPTAKAN